MMDTRTEMAFRVYLWQLGRLDSYTGRLFDLWSRGSPMDRALLGAVYPNECSVLQEWFESETPGAFMGKYGIGTANPFAMVAEEEMTDEL